MAARSLWFCCFFLSLSALAGEPEFFDVFTPQTDGFPSIRIPAVVVTPAGAVLAFAEGRAADADQARNKIVLKRSLDGGKTWSKVGVIAADGARALNNPCAVIERGAGRVLLMFQSYPAGVGERSGQIEPGYAGERIVRNLLIASDDDGQTWSAPRDLTQETKRAAGVTTIASGPGLGIQLRRGAHAGRLLMPMNEGPFGRWNIYAAYSDDGGERWTIGDVAPGALIEAPKAGATSAPTSGATSIVNEAQFVELSDGSIRFNVRRWAGRPLRKTSVSVDGGATWSEIDDVHELSDPGCMGSVFRYSDPADGQKSRLLYSGPRGERREQGTVFISYDEGRTWPASRLLRAGGFGYSCLTALPDGAIGCLCEVDGARRIVFARFTLDWLTAGGDEPARLD